MKRGRMPKGREQSGAAAQALSMALACAAAQALSLTLAGPVFAQQVASPRPTARTPRPLAASFVRGTRSVCGCACRS